MGKKRKRCENCRCSPRKREKHSRPSTPNKRGLRFQSAPRLPWSAALRRQLVPGRHAHWSAKKLLQGMSMRISSRTGAMETAQRKRAIEMRHLRGDGVYWPRFGVSMLGVRVPTDVILVILSYLRAGPGTMNGPGLACSELYVCCLESFRRVRFRVRGAYDIPVLAAMRSSVVSVDCWRGMRPSEIRHIRKCIGSVEVLKINGPFKDFAACGTGCPVRCRTLVLSQLEWGVDRALWGIDWNPGSFPALSSLWFDASVAKFGDSSVPLRNLVTIVITEDMRFWKDGPGKLRIPPYFGRLSCLRTLAMELPITSGSWGVVSGMPRLARLIVSVEGPQDSEQLRLSYARLGNLESCGIILSGGAVPDVGKVLLGVCSMVSLAVLCVCIPASPRPGRLPRGMDESIARCPRLRSVRLWYHGNPQGQWTKSVGGPPREGVEIRVRAGGIFDRMRDCLELTEIQ